MLNQMIPVHPNYSGVTIQIANPTVNAGENRYPYYQQQDNGRYIQAPYTQPTNMNYPQQHTGNVPNYTQVPNYFPAQQQNTYAIKDLPENQTIAPVSYPPEYYINNLNKKPELVNEPTENLDNSQNVDNTVDKYKETSNTISNDEQDLSTSKALIQDLDARAEEAKAKKENAQKKNVIALTDEYIKSLENYLNNPNEEIRLMASKEILTRLDEDRNRQNDVALNALLNKMLQDPSKLIRIASLSAFSSGLANGNDYTMQLLQDIQKNPNADKEDVLQAADILLRKSTKEEVVNIPNPNEETKTQN